MRRYRSAPSPSSPAPSAPAAATRPPSSPGCFSASCSFDCDARYSLPPLQKLRVRSPAPAASPPHTPGSAPPISVATCFEKIPVMAHHHAPQTLAVAQHPLQPLNPLQIQVIRRLVQQQHIGRRHQRLRNRQPLLPPAAQRRPPCVSSPLPAPEPATAALASAPSNPSRPAVSRSRPSHSLSATFAPLERPRSAPRESSGPAAKLPSPADHVRDASPFAHGHLAPYPRSSSPARHFSSVDFPAPFGPMSPMRSPSETVNEISLKRGVAPKALVRP